MSPTELIITNFKYKNTTYTFKSPVTVEVTKVKKQYSLLDSYLNVCVCGESVEAAKVEYENMLALMYSAFTKTDDNDLSNMSVKLKHKFMERIM